MSPTFFKHQKLALALTVISTCSIKKKKRKYWCKKWLLLRKSLRHANILKELEPDDYKNFLRMDESHFEDLLAMVTPFIKKNDILMRDTVSPRDRFIVTLRFLATGASYEDLKFRAIISPQLLCKIIPETCWAIYISLKEYIKMPKSEAEWLETAEDFEKKWNFPHTIGAIDGKHVEIEKPPGSGSLFYNYKHFFSIVLFAMVNAKYEFMFVSVGTNGCASDAAILKNTTFYRKLMQDKLNLPQPCPLSNGTEPVPYVCLGDIAFSLNRHIMKPFPFRDINKEKRIFNYRLSRARRVVENAFGILASRFRVLRQSMNMNVENVDYIVLACCALHNYLLKTSRNTYLTPKSVDHEDVRSMKFQSGDWRQAGRLTPLEKCSERQRNEEGNNIRNIFTEHFNGPGRVPFQEQMLRVVRLSDE